MTDDTTPTPAGDQVKRTRRTKAEMVFLRAAKQQLQQAKALVRDVMAGVVPAPPLPKAPKVRRKGGTGAPSVDVRPLLAQTVTELVASQSKRQVQQAQQAQRDAQRLAVAQGDRANEAVATAELLTREVQGQHKVGHAAAAIAHAMQQPLADLQTINSSELGKLIGRSTKSVNVDSVRRPHTLPPRFVIPGTRKLRWRVIDVREWMDALAEIEADRRAQAVAFSKVQGLGPAYYAPRIATARKDVGAEATQRMLAKRAAQAAKTSGGAT